MSGAFIGSVSTKVARLTNELCSPYTHHRMPTRPLISRPSVVWIATALALAFSGCANNTVLNEATQPTTQPSTQTSTQINRPFPTELGAWQDGGPRPGFSLVTWSGNSAADTRNVIAAIDEVAELGAASVTLVTYRLLDADTGGLSTHSKHGLPDAPTNEYLREAAKHASDVGLHVSITPLVEIDNRVGTGEIFRGTFLAEGDIGERFTTDYRAYLLELADLAEATMVDRLYIASELDGLVLSPPSASFWQDLIQLSRTHFSGEISYAANWSGVESVNFAKSLDSLGIDAYFPLASAQEALGAGLPDVDLLVEHWVAILDSLEDLLPADIAYHFSEWGIINGDGATAEPWSIDNADSPDPIERRNALQALVDVLGAPGVEGPTEVVFWHWGFEGGSSPFSINQLFGSS